MGGSLLSRRYDQAYLRRKLRRIFTLLALLCVFSAGRVRAEKLNTKTVETLTGGTWVKSGKSYKYRKSDGTYAANGFKKIDGRWFFLKKNGKAARGLRKLNGKYYYFNPSGKAGTLGRMQTGLVTIKGVKYIFRRKGGVGTKGSRVESAWRKVKGKKYYFTSDGSMGSAYHTDAQFIKTVGKLAKADMKRTGILASVTIAQAILESGFGRSELALESNNLFGMRASLSGNTWKSDWDGKTYEIKTKEYTGGRYTTVKAAFRAYSSWADSIRDHSRYLAGAMNGNTRRYKGVVRNKSYRKTLQIIKNGGYATSPTYVSTLVSVIKRYKLTKYDK